MLSISEYLRYFNMWFVWEVNLKFNFFINIYGLTIRFTDKNVPQSDVRIIIKSIVYVNVFCKETLIKCFTSF